MVNGEGLKREMIRKFLNEYQFYIVVSVVKLNKIREYTINLTNSLHYAIYLV